MSWLSPVATVILLFAAAPASGQEPNDIMKINAEVLQLGRSGKLAEAEALALKTVKATEASAQADMAAFTLSTLGLVYSEHHAFDRGLTVLQRAIKTCEARPQQGLCRRALSSAWNNLALVHEGRADVAAARAAFERSLATLDTQRPGHELAEASINENLGNLERQLGQYKQA